jgi:RAD54-like protein 2
MDIPNLCPTAPHDEENYPSIISNEHQLNEKSAEEESKQTNENEEQLMETEVVATTVESNESGKKENSEKKIQNMRKNIKDVLENANLDEATISAQKLELERLSRVQEAQRLLRENQRQLQVEKQVIKTQQKVLSLLGGEKIDTSAQSEIPDVNFENSSNEIKPQNEQNNLRQPQQDPKFVIDIDSDSDDCIILSDDEEEIDSDDEEDEGNSGEHTNDSYNKPEPDGSVVLNIGHKENESKVYIAPQLSRIIKVCSRTIFHF